MLFSAVFPGGAGEQSQNGEDLQSASQHIEDQDQLAEGAVASKITGRTYRFHAGANVVETGQGCRQIGLHRESIQRNHQKDHKDDHNVSCQVGVGVRQNLLVHRPAAGADHHHLFGIEDLPDVPPEDLKQQQYTNAFKTAAGGTGAGTDDHQQHDDGFGESRPQVKIRGGKAGGGDDGADLEGTVAQGFAPGAVQVADVEHNNRDLQKYDTNIGP